MSTLQIMFLVALSCFVMSCAFGITANKTMWTDTTRANILAAIALLFYGATALSVFALIFLALGAMR